MVIVKAFTNMYIAYLQDGLANKILMLAKILFSARREGTRKGHV